MEHTSEQIIRAIQLARADKCRALISRVEDQLFDLRTIHGGFILEGSTLRAVLRDFPELKDRHECLQHRLWLLRRMLWKLA